MLSVRLAYGIICSAVGHVETAEAILAEGMATEFAGDPGGPDADDQPGRLREFSRSSSPTSHAAAMLLPLLEPFVGEVSFTGLTSQGPIAAYVGKLESLLGRHELAEEHLRAALAVTERFGWNYHRATTLYALAEARHRRLGALDAEGRAWLDEASALCRSGGFAIWIPKIDALANAQPEAALPADVDNALAGSDARPRNAASRSAAGAPSGAGCSGPYGCGLLAARCVGHVRDRLEPSVPRPSPARGRCPGRWPWRGPTRAGTCRARRAPSAARPRTCRTATSRSCPSRRLGAARRRRQPRLDRRLGPASPGATSTPVMLNGLSRNASTIMCCVPMV